jgi:hypothetical protein
MVPDAVNNDPILACDPGGFPRIVLHNFRTSEILQTPTHMVVLYKFQKRTGRSDRRRELQQQTATHGDRPVLPFVLSRGALAGNGSLVESAQRGHNRSNPPRARGDRSHPRRSFIDTHGTRRRQRFSAAEEVAAEGKEARSSSSGPFPRLRAGGVLHDRFLQSTGPRLYVRRRMNRDAVAGAPAGGAGISVSDAADCSPGRQLMTEDRNYTSRAEHDDLHQPAMSRRRFLAATARRQRSVLTWRPEFAV